MAEETTISPADLVHILFSVFPAIGTHIRLSLLLLFPLVASAETLIGHADKVRDEDTVVVSRVPIRPQGAAAPEVKQKWGRASQEAMQHLIAGERLICELTGEKSWDREIGVCRLDDGTDIGAAIIAQGLARDCPRFSGGRYVEFETEKSRTLPLPDYCR